MAAPSVTAWSIPRSRSNGTPAPEHRPDLTRASNETLVELAKMGNGAAFEKLMERHHQFCLSKALSILRNRGDAEDEVQNAFARAWTHLWQYRGGGSFGAWLTRILSNQCLMRLRERTESSRPFLTIDRAQSMDHRSDFFVRRIEKRISIFLGSLQQLILHFGHRPRRK